MTSTRMGPELWTAGADYHGGDAAGRDHELLRFFQPWDSAVGMIARAAHLGATPTEWKRLRADYEGMVNSRRRGDRLARQAWRALMASIEPVTIVCVCMVPEHCHRTWLAELMAEAGADYRGERSIG